MAHATFQMVRPLKASSKLDANSSKRGVPKEGFLLISRLAILLSRLLTLLE
jgi:hypothetical protein